MHRISCVESAGIAHARLRRLALLMAGVWIGFFHSQSPLASSSPNSPSAARSSTEEQERLQILQRDIETLRRGIETLAGTEKGVLGELKTLEAVALRKQGELARVEARIRSTENEASFAAKRAGEVARRVDEMRGPVARRLRALYRLGPPRYFRVLLASAQPADLLSAYRTAASLSGRDRALLDSFREESGALKREAAHLAALRAELLSEHSQRKSAADEAAATLERKRALLFRIRSDRQVHQSALGEMEAAASSFGRVLSGLPAASAVQSPRIDFARFRGLLDWPADGPVSARFGRLLNPKFGTTLVHSGLDIDAPFGAPVRVIQDGVVVFSQWFRGYGLTVIVDHGGTWLSVYSHASALLAEKGEHVRRGQKIGVVGDSGSLRGPYLYFEIRKEGRPVDPAGWLRPR